MVRIENHCVGCPTCINCGLKQVKVYYCDKCKDEIPEDVYEVDGAELCEDCLKKEFKKEF